MTSQRYTWPGQVPWKAVAAGSAGVLGLSLLLRAYRVETRGHVLNDQKFVDADPEGLARNAGATLDEYALASMMQSEEHSRLGRLAVAQATLNYCRKKKVSPSTLLLRAVYKGRRQPSHGRLGSNEAPGKWASTARPPTSSTLQMAKDLLRSPGRFRDPTGGAIAWDAPEVQDRAHERDPKTYSKDSRMVAADRVAAGGREVRVPGVPDTRFWVFS